MFEYFPGNYVWNLAVVGTINSGGRIDEVDRACRPIKEAALRGDDLGTGDFLSAWTDQADRLIGMAEDDETLGRYFSAAAKYDRASTYLLAAERMQSSESEGRKAIYQRAIDLFHRSIQYRHDDVEILEVPYEGSFLPAYFKPAKSIDGSPTPCIIQINGLDSFKESMLTSGFADMLAQRGIATLMVDQPGTGGALRLNDLPAIVDTEDWASACVDYLQKRDEIDPDRIGIVGWSLGGYYAPRAAAFEDRLKLCVAWGANHHWGETQKRRLRAEGERPVPHYWNHVLWVWGEDNVDDFMANVAAKMTLDGVVEKITAPFLITHGINDRQIPVADAQLSYDQAVNSSRRELRIFTEHEGGVEHVHLDAPDVAMSFIADWIAETFGTRTGL